MTEQQYALDTSVAIPLLVSTHPAHGLVTSWARGRSIALAGHALTETYSVLTRLPGDARLSPRDAVTLIDDNIAHTLCLPDSSAGQVHQVLAQLGIAGGAVYDGLVALAARAHDAVLVTRDARARNTYAVVAVTVELLGDPEPPS